MNSRLTLRLLALVAALILGLAACSSDDSSSGDAPADDEAAEADTGGDDGGGVGAGEVSIENIAYGTDNLTVAAGDTVTWTNLDAVPHTVSSADGSPLEFDSETFLQDESFNLVFEEAGTYEYFCMIHPDAMMATVTVE